MSDSAAITVLLFASVAERAEHQARQFQEHTPAGLCTVWRLLPARTSDPATGVLIPADAGGHLYTANSDPAVAWNQALALTRSPYVLFLHTEQSWRPECLAAVHARLIEATADLAYVGWSNRGSNCLPPDLRHEDPQLYWLQQTPWPLAACVFSRTALAKVGGLDPEYGEAAGYDLLLRLGAKPRCVRHAAIGLDLDEAKLEEATPAERVASALRLAQIRSRCLSRFNDTPTSDGRRLRQELILRPLLSLAQELRAQQAYREALQVYQYLCAGGDYSASTLWGGLQAGWAWLTRR